MLIAEELLLLLLDEESGKLLVDAQTHADPALAGSVLVELAIAGRVDIAAENDGGGESATVKAGRLYVRDASPIGDPLLDEAMNRMADWTGKRPQTVVQKLVKGLRKTLAGRLAAAGVLSEEHARVLGLFPTTRWPERDARPEHEIRARVAAVLDGSTAVDIRTGRLAVHGADRERARQSRSARGPGGTPRAQRARRGDRRQRLGIGSDQESRAKYSVGHVVGCGHRGDGGNVSRGLSNTHASSSRAASAAAKRSAAPGA